MASTYKVEVGNYGLTTTVVKTITQLDKSLGDLLSTIGATMRSQIRPLIALDIEKHYNHNNSRNQVTGKVAVVKLCFDKTCLIIQLLQMNEPPCSLAEFFQLQELSFVGVGISSNLDALSRDYGLQCKNAVDLGLLAATVKSEKFKSVGLLDLAYELNVLNNSTCWILHKVGATVLGGWGNAVLSQQQIEAATWGAFICSCISDHLIRGDGYKISTKNLKGL